MEASLSSRVTVEYHDPSGVFPLISRDLASRLPLRNLNWKSPTRPLRSIGALHVEFVPDAATAAKTEKAQLQRADSYGPGAAAGGESSSAVAKERRHQIPGLLQTPYLKIYLLRCDDKDAYKAESRQLLRDWVRDNTPPAQTSSSLPNKTENHDASEWLILHVVIPDTVAASEPRWTAASRKDTDELVERPQSSTKWPGKSTRTVLDKIRADFNSSSKAAPERVAQLRLQKKDVPPPLLPQTPVPSLYTESPQEQDNAWQDLVAKFKTMILMSFDLRVSQYEDDIREKDAQRSLPGWNFCTFFTLKEGLARGFESVGLVEDALAIYDELSAGLETQSTFLGDLDTYKDALRQTLATASNDEKANTIVQPLRDLFNEPLDLTKKDYRGEIVKNTISLFDFHLYIFARQRTLLLRLGSGNGTAQQKRPSSSQGSAPRDDDLTFSAEVCRRAAAFAATNSRTLRKGLQASGFENEVSSSSSHYATLVESLASSWTYSVLDQILIETASDRLPLPKSAGDALSAPQQKLGPSGASRKDAFNFPQGANSHPSRTSSLKRSTSGSSSGGPPPLTVSNAINSPALPGSGVAILAAGRAELFMMQRKVVETIAKRKSWSTGWATLVKAGSLSDVDLNGASENLEASPADEPAPTLPEKISVQLLGSLLASALASVEAFRASYEELTNHALSHYTIAGHAKSADMITSDLAILKYQSGDYAQAATLFQRSSPSYLQGHWTYLHSELLRAYANCLKELHRKDEYMRVMLSLLSKVIVRQRARGLPNIRLPKLDKYLAWLDDEAVDVTGVLDEVAAYSQEMPYNFTAKVGDFFGDIHVSPEVIHYDDKDGFSLDVQFRHLLDDSLRLDRVRLRLSSAKEPGQEIWLQSEGQVDLEQGLVKLKLHSNITTHGSYLIDKLLLEVNKLHFMHEFQPKPKPTPLGITNITSSDQRQASAAPSILLYPHGRALEARATLTRTIHVDKLRSIVLDLDTGRNDTESLDLRLRGASAGLRLHTADAIVIEGEADLDTSQGGLIRLGSKPAATSLRISLPYSLEHTLNEISIRLEAQYTTTSGSFVFQSSCVIPVDLSLDVDVYDIFRAESLFSKFSIRTTTSIPLQVKDVQLQDSAIFAVQALPCPLPMSVFEKQPASLTYKITKKMIEEGNEASKKDAALAMTVQYFCIDEVILDQITSTLESALEDSPYAQLKRLLMPVVRSGAQSHALALQLERAVLLQELTLPAYETIGWARAISNLSPTIRDGLAEWLRGWHELNKHISLDPATQSPTRKITISVDVPTVSVVHTAKLTLTNKPSVSAPAIVGTPLLATLSIKHTRRWAAAPPPSSSPTSPTPSDGPLSFVYTLSAPAETWLIGGQRRAHFSFSTASEREERTFSIVLIPLKQGTWLLPSVDIASVRSDEGAKRESGMWMAVSKRQSGEVGGGGGGGGSGSGSGRGAMSGVKGEEEAGVSCEVDYTSSAQTVLVGRDVRTTTVNVSGGGGGSSHAHAYPGDERRSIATTRMSEDYRSSRIVG